jgi:hypothetical protein
MKDVTISGVTKKNFEGVDFIAKATARENVQANKAIRQKSVQALFTMFKGDPDVPNQPYLRELVAEEFGLSPTQIDKLMTQNEQQPQPQAPQAPQGQPEIPTMPNQPQMSAVQSAAQTGVNH